MLKNKITKNLDVNLTGKVAVLKLLSGEEIIARVLAHDPGISIVLQDCLLCVMDVNHKQPTQAAVSYAPWMICVDDDAKVEIHQTKIIAITTASKPATKAYEDATGNVGEADEAKPV